MARLDPIPKSSCGSTQMPDKKKPQKKQGLQGPAKNFRYCRFTVSIQVFDNPGPPAKESELMCVYYSRTGYDNFLTKDSVSFLPLCKKAKEKSEPLSFHLWMSFHSSVLPLPSLTFNERTPSTIPLTDTAIF